MRRRARRGRPPARRRPRGGGVCGARGGRAPLRRAVEWAVRRGAPRGRGARARGPSSKDLLQPGERAVRPRLDGSAGDSKRCSGLFLRQLEEVAAGDYVAVVVAQPLHGGEETLPAFTRERGRLGILTTCPGLGRRAQRQRGAASACATAV